MITSPPTDHSNGVLKLLAVALFLSHSCPWPFRCVRSSLHVLVSAFFSFFAALFPLPMFVFVFVFFCFRFLLLLFCIVFCFHLRLRRLLRHTVLPVHRRDLLVGRQARGVRKGDQGHGGREGH